MATIKKLYFPSGVDVTAPTDLTSESSTVHVAEYVDDAAFVTANGTATGGDLYINTTLKALRLYTGSSWRTVIMSTDDADPTKTFLVDLDGATTGTSATLDFNQTASRVYTFPDYAGIVALNTGTETSPTLFSGATGTTTIGHSSGTVSIAGNFEVQGTQTILNTQTVEVEDANIIVNNGGNDATSEGAGLTVERTGTHGSLIYKAASATKFALGNLGSEVDAADISTSQTFTNKTMSGASNTFTNIDLTSATSGVLPTTKGGTGVNGSASYPSSGTVATVPSSGVVKSNGSVLSASNVSLTTEVTGTLPIANGGTGQTTANAALNALLPAQTGENGKYLKTDGTNTSWDTASGGGSESTLVVTNANYTVLDGDGYTTFLFSTGGSNRTLTLPTLSANENRAIRIVKIDSGSGEVIVDGEGAETINGSTTQTLRYQYDTLEIQAYTSEWSIIQKGLAGKVTGQPSNTTIGSGLIGEIQESKATGGTITSTPANMTSISLTAGIWLLSGQVSFKDSGWTTFEISINTTSATHGTLGDNRMAAADDDSNGWGGLTIAGLYAAVSSTTTYYLVASCNTTQTNAAGYRITAVRIA